MKLNVVRSEKLATTALVALVFFLALALRLVMLTRFSHVVFLNEADAMGYLSMAKAIASDFSLGGATHFPPFYPFVCAVFSFFVADLETAGRLAAVFMGAFLVVPVYFVAENIAGRRVGLLAALASAGCGVFLDFSLQPISQMTYLTMLMTVTALGTAAVSSRSMLLNLALGGACAALYLTRPEGILSFFFLLALLLVARHFDRSAPVKSRLASLAWFVAGFALLALPYLVFLRRQTGAWTISGKSGVTILGVDASMKLLPDGTTLGEKSAGHLGVTSLFSDFGSFLHTYQENALKFLTVLLEQFSLAWFVLSLLGLILLAADLVRTPARERTGYLLRLLVTLTGALVVLPVFAFSNLSVGPSYILPLFPLLLIGLCRSAAAFERFLLGRLPSFVRGLAPVRWGMPLLSLPVVLIFGYFSMAPLWTGLSSDDFRDYAASQEFFLKQTGQWLNSNTPEGSMVMARWSQIGFYGDRPWRGLADGSIQEVVAYLRKNRIGYLAIDSVAVPRRRPQLAPLLDPELPVPGLRPVYARQEYDIRVIIYQVL